MKIIFKPEDMTVCFGDVKENQFFVNLAGCLSMKKTDTSYVVIAKYSGKPFCTSYDMVTQNMEIDRILPTVDKIEF